MEERCSDLRLKELSGNIYGLFLGLKKGFNNKNISLVKLNEENLSKYGDVCILMNIEIWRKVFPNHFQSISNSRNLLEYYLTENKVEFKDEEAIEKAFREIIQASINWSFKIEKCALQNERVCIFLNRKNIYTETVNRIVERDINYGILESRNKSFRFNIVYDEDSELTNLRLHLLKGVAENIIKAQGYEISNNIATAANYNFTTKSKSSSKDIVQKIILCGVAKNPKTKTKETKITKIQYYDDKLRELLDTSENKLLDSDPQSTKKNSTLRKIAEAAIALEFLAVKPSRPITILDTANAKGSSFVLYNTARISAILDRFNEECLRGNYPSLLDITEVDFSLLDQEEEWELTYNYLLRYPDMIESCLRLEPEEELEISPQYICSFLSRFCNKFSAYYRRVRILTEGRDHLVPTMMARLHLLKAAQTVICNALRLLNIDSISRM